MRELDPATQARITPGPDPLVLVHSHLRWDFVWQRPQQLMSRLARDGRVVFVEEPVLAADIAQSRLAVTTPEPGVTRVVPMLPDRFRERGDDAIAEVRGLLQRERRAGGVLAAPAGTPIVQWFYTPMPAPEMLGAFGEAAVVYDCMDELAKFRFAPPDISRRERLLLSRSDVVFTGGRRLYESKARYHDNVHFFGCGVDVAHFAQARDAATPLPDDVAGIEGPVLGYVGVIDERLDYALIGALAAARADWTVVMVGPVVKVDPAELPQASNIRWLGQRPFTELPRYIRRFDVCLMPFALNEATEYINPTKTLEYMAAGKPIVSTPVADVVRNFTPVVQIARTPEAFIALCGEAIAEPDEALLAAGIARAAGASWDSIVAQMQILIGSAIAGADASASDEALAQLQREWSTGGADGVAADVPGVARRPRRTTAHGPAIAAALVDALEDGAPDLG